MVRVHRDDVLVWAGVILLAVAAAAVHPSLALAIGGTALIIDGMFGGRRP